MLAVLTVYRMGGIVDDSVVPRGQFAGVAFCWAILLLAGLARPVERAWILTPTALVIGCIAAAFVVGYIAGTVGFVRLTFVLFICAALIWLCRAGLKQAQDHLGGGKSQT